MASGGKTNIVNEKRKRATFKMREALNFDPTLTILHNQEDIIEYLEKHHGSLLPGIEVEWCPWDEFQGLSP